MKKFLDIYNIVSIVLLGLWGLVYFLRGILRWAYLLPDTIIYNFTQKLCIVEDILLYTSIPLTLIAIFLRIIFNDYY